MDKRILLNIGLAAALGTLVLVAIYRPGLDTTPAIAPITLLKADGIQTITLQRTGQHDIELRRNGTQWQLVKPYPAPGNQHRLARLLELLALKPERSYHHAQLDLQQIGLAQPLLRVRFDGTEIAFGRLNPLDNTRYIRIGDQIHLIADDYFDLLNGPVTGLIDTALLPEGAEITAITLNNGLKIQKTDGKWVLNPVSTVSGDAIQNHLTHWKNDRALAITEYNGDEHPEGSVLIQLKGQTNPLRFDILGTEPELVLGRPDLGLAYHMTEGAQTNLLQLSGD